MSAWKQNIAKIRDSYCQEQWLHHVAENRETLLSLDQLEKLIFVQGVFPHDCVHSVTAPNPPKDLEGEGAEVAMTAFGNGETLILRKADLNYPLIGSLASELAEELDTEVHANLYLTPPQSQGFRLHFDRHDVVVLQLIGNKVWEICDRVTPVPLNESLLSGLQKMLLESALDHKSEPDVSSNRKIRVNLDVNDWMYLPRGIAHSARSQNSVSLHCTFALIKPSICEVLSLETFATFAKKTYGPNRWDAKNSISKNLNQKGKHTELMSYTIELSKQRSRRPLPGHYLYTLANLKKLDLDSQLKRRDGLFPWLGDVEGEKQFIFANQRYRVPKETEILFRFLASKKNFKVKDLPVKNLDIDQVEMCRDLIQEGLLEFLL